NKGQSAVELGISKELKASEFKTVTFASSRYKKVPFKNLKSISADNNIPVFFQLGTLVGPLVANNYLAPVMNMKGVPVGTDKLGHFFEEGFIYFNYFGASQDETVVGGKNKISDAYLSVFGEFLESDFEAVPIHVRNRLSPLFNEIMLQYADSSKEFFRHPSGAYDLRGFFGLRGSGVYSPADLAANNAGNSFYHDLYENWNDNTWTFKFANYISDLSILNEYKFNPNTYHPYMKTYVLP